MGNRISQDESYENLRSSKFKQQRLPGWRPVPNIISSSIIFFCIGIVFIALGVILLIFSSKIIEISYRYEKECEFKSECNIKIPIESDMTKPILIYYELLGFYQSFRHFVNSKNSDQLKGRRDVSDEQLKIDCGHALTNGQMNKKKSIINTDLVEDENAIPCGLLAKSFFNDTYDFAINNEKIIPNETNIAWKYDIENNYNNSAYPEKQWIDMTDEHFIVWMRPAPFDNFRKLWGRIDNRDLKKGEELIVTIHNNYPVTNFNGTKNLILTTVSVIGGKNYLLSYSYIVIGAICVILGVFLVVGNKFLFNKEK